MNNLTICDVFEYAGDIPLFAREVLGVKLDAKQTALLRSDSRRVILNCCRQWGKSTVTAVKAVHCAIFQPGSLTVVVSPSARQSAEFVLKVRMLAARASERVRGDGENRASAVFTNGSRVAGLPASEDTTRGFSGATLLIVDEASRVKDSLYFAMLPILSTTGSTGDKPGQGGEVWLLSTPNGRTGFFWKTWNECDDWFRLQVTADESPRVNRKVLAEHKKIFSGDLFRQEYMCEFLAGDDALFNMDQVDKLYLPHITALNV